MSDEPGVTVSLAQMYAVLLEVKSTVEHSAGRHDATDARVSDHESRLRSLERKVWQAAGAAGVLAGAAGYVVSVVTHAA